MDGSHDKWFGWWEYGIHCISNIVLHTVSEKLKCLEHWSINCWSQYSWDKIFKWTDHNDLINCLNIFNTDSTNWIVVSVWIIFTFINLCWIILQLDKIWKITFKIEIYLKNYFITLEMDHFCFHQSNMVKNICLSLKKKSEYKMLSMDKCKHILSDSNNYECNSY